MTIKVCYQQRVNQPELTNFEKEVSRHSQVCEIIDNYPLDEEIKLCEETGEGVGFYIFKGNLEEKFAAFQFTPEAKGFGMLSLELKLKSGFLNIFGRQVIFKDFDLVSIEDGKKKLKELFEHSIESLYERYKAK